MSATEHAKIGSFRSVGQLRDRLVDLGIELPCDSEVLPAPDSPMAQPINIFGRQARNRFAIHPMEGWDADASGSPTKRVFRRWMRFGQSGAALIWGGEAAAVRPDGRANPNQLVLSEANETEIKSLRTALVDAHDAEFGSSGGLVVGLQLTHSGRYSRPQGAPAPAALYRHPLLDDRVGITSDAAIMSDDDVRLLIRDYIRAARAAQRCGFDFVDIKHCHGYLGHEFLSAYTRPGDYGGSLQNRTRFLREVVTGIRADAPGLGIGVRLSAFDLVPYVPENEQSAPGKLGEGVPQNYCDAMPYRFAFGCDQEMPVQMDLSETVELLRMMLKIGVQAVNLTAGSPYYNPHIQRPALYPPSDGYSPPEDPLIGVARQMHAVRFLKQYVPEMPMVGTAYSYLQQFVGHVAQAAVREGWVDIVGLGRMALSYPTLPTDILAGRALHVKRVCRTFSDCTTAPRNGLPSGCYPLDEEYKSSSEAKLLAAAKRATKAGGAL